MRAIDADALQELCNRRIQDTWNSGTAPVSWAAAYADFKDDIDSIPTLTPPNEWVSVEERLPEEKQRVIVRCERVGTSVGWILWSNWMTDIGPGAGKVTHWMPLPAPPDRRPPEGGIAR